MRDLVIQAQNGDRDAFAALVHMTSDRMYGLAARILRDNVDPRRLGPSEREAHPCSACAQSGWPSASP